MKKIQDTTEQKRLEALQLKEQMYTSKALKIEHCKQLKLQKLKSVTEVRIKKMLAKKEMQCHELKKRDALVAHHQAEVAEELLAKSDRKQKPISVPIFSAVDSV